MSYVDRRIGAVGARASHDFRTFIAVSSTKAHKQAETISMASWKDAPSRPPWLAKLSWRSRQSWLLRSYLQDRIGTLKDAHARSLIRAFLGAYDKFHGGGNIAGIELEVSPVSDDPRACYVYPSMPNIGRIMWLPCLETEMTEAIADITRECSPFEGVKLHHEPVSRKPDDDRKWGGFPPPPPTVLYLPPRP